MKIDRRQFLQLSSAGMAAIFAPEISKASTGSPPADCMGMLVDTTTCIGCRKCEYACNNVHNLSEKSMESFDDKSVFKIKRRMEADSYTIVNQYPNIWDSKPIYVKFQCMHCLEPACVSACLVGALQHEENGAVTYDAWKCMGCRYCLVACPFQVPAYEYENAFDPVVSKCNFCYERVSKEGKIPACAEVCPPMCLTFGKRSELLDLAHRKIEANPQAYFAGVYGEHEAGGTSWLYLAGRSFQDIGFLKLENEAPPKLTEAVQHGVFKFGIPPLLLYGLLGAIMWVFRKKEDSSDFPSHKGEPIESSPEGGSIDE